MGAYVTHSDLQACTLQRRHFLPFVSGHGGQTATLKCTLNIYIFILNYIYIFCCTAAPSCLSSSLLPSFCCCLSLFLHPKETIFVESACVLLFPCVFSHWWVLFFRDPLYYFPKVKVQAKSAVRSLLHRNVDYFWRWRRWSKPEKLCKPWSPNRKSFIPILQTCLKRIKALFFSSVLHGPAWEIRVALPG